MNAFKEQFLRQSRQFLSNPNWRLNRLGMNRPAQSMPAATAFNSVAAPVFDPVAASANIGNVNLPAFQPMQRQTLRTPAPTMQDRIGSFY